MQCIATPSAPFTEAQRNRVGTVLEIQDRRAHVEWAETIKGTDRVWRTRVWLPLEWIHIS